MKRFIALVALALAACGNADQGAGLKKKNIGASTSVTFENLNPNIVLGPCKNMTVFGGTDPSFANTYIGSSACASTSHQSTVRLRVPANFPTDQRFCLVPLSNTQVFRNASCFTINGQADIALSTAAFTRVVMVREAELQAYYNYVDNPAAGSWPPMAYAELR